jgi:CxxC-x17-CxxC domain-containing protein
VEYQDTDLTCSDCGNTFAFSSSEQEFYASRGFQNPKRCPGCREQRRGNGNGHSRHQREMYTTTCSRCGKEAQVPFVPRLDRPVYCSECFQPAAKTASYQ